MRLCLHCSYRLSTTALTRTIHSVAVTSGLRRSLAFVVHVLQSILTVNLITMISELLGF